MKISLLFTTLMAEAVHAQFDFGNPSGDGDCGGGSGSFQQQISRGIRRVVGEIPAGLQGLAISLTSNADVDIQLTSGGTEVINWDGGVMNDATLVTRTWRSDSITYSGYNGEGGGRLGHEFVQFNDETSNAYTLYAFGYRAGFATVDYSWTGQDDCDSAADSASSGSGSFVQPIAKDEVVTVGELPAGLTDVYVRLDSEADIDIQLYDEDNAIIHWQNGILQGDKFQTTNYAGVEVQYSGYNGEQRDDAKGQEYIFLKGRLSKTVALSVLGYQAGTARVEYSWGYYASATSSDSTMLKSQLHDIVDGHTELTYTPGVWEALMRTDQDNDNPDNVILLYSRRSESKANRDRGGSDPDAWNREHVYAKSHGDFGTSRGPGTDIHALRASDKTVNSERAAKDFSDGGSQLSDTEPREDCPDCFETNDSFEPPDSVKGDVARMIFYMVVRYNGDNDSNGVELDIVDGVGTPNGSSTSKYGEIGDLQTLKEWHIFDPVSDEERHRNNLIYDIQGNRNPFIDNPQFVEILF